MPATYELRSPIPHRPHHLCSILAIGRNGAVLKIKGILILTGSTVLEIQNAIGEIIH